MLARLPSSLLPTAVSLAKATTPCVQKLPSCARYNSSTVITANSDGHIDTTPKKRAIPLAQTLGDINIANPRRHGGQDQRRGSGGHRWSNASGNGGQQQHQNSNGNGNRRQGQNGNRNGGQRQNNIPRTNGYTSTKANAGDFQSAQTNIPSTADQDQLPSHEQQSDTVAPQSEVPSGPFRKRGGARSREGRVNIPAPNKIELGNLDELFGPSVPQSAPAHAVQTSTSNVTPSQARAQLLLERTAGDYSRYVPQPYPTTEVTKLGSVGLAGFVLSRKRDAGLGARQHALTVVQKFSGGDSRTRPASS